MMSNEYLSFSKRERRGIITLVFLLIIVAATPKFACRPGPVVEKLPDKELQQLAQNNHYKKEKTYSPRDTIYVRESAHPLYQPPKLQRRGSWFNSSTYAKASADKAGWVPHTQFPKPKPPSQPIDINTADTTALIALPGIGSKLANRIISFRTALGGFNSVDQIKKVYGLQDSVYQKILPMLTLK